MLARFVLVWLCGTFRRFQKEKAETRTYAYFLLRSFFHFSFFFSTLNMHRTTTPGVIRAEAETTTDDARPSAKIGTSVSVALDKQVNRIANDRRSIQDRTVSPRTVAYCTCDLRFRRRNRVEPKRVCRIHSASNPFTIFVVARRLSTRSIKKKFNVSRCFTFSVLRESRRCGRRYN